MKIKKGEVICIASGVFEGYDRTGPFVAIREFDLVVFIETVMPSDMKPSEISGLMYEVPELLLEHGLIARMPCRNIYLGAMGEIEIGEEKDIPTL
ncbi:hypothetical protein C7A11_25045 [Pseudomonas simiae]|uniref:hypothetical protein n=1 Tax=Pseudomonas simiae TaxID=321846 RepID=UPI000D044D94|nr:hypothetical protein [Pseudomonas simiae]PRW84818.1 hypothetical protein C7A11_25045 [Pseudomonas simiae]